jgi:hypothetical protein
VIMEVTRSPLLFSRACSKSANLQTSVSISSAIRGSFFFPARLDCCVEQSGHDLVAEESELVPPPHCWEVASMDLAKAFTGDA